MGLFDDIGSSRLEDVDFNNLTEEQKKHFHKVERPPKATRQRIIFESEYFKSDHYENLMRSLNGLPPL